MKDRRSEDSEPPADDSVCPEHGVAHGDGEDASQLLADQVGLASDSKELNENEVTNDQLDEQIEEFHAEILAKNLSKHDAIVDNIVRQNEKLQSILSPLPVASQGPSNTLVNESNFLKVPKPTGSRSNSRSSRASSVSGSSRGASRSGSRASSRTSSQKRTWTEHEETEEEPEAKKEKIEKGRKKKESGEKKSRLSRKKKKEEEKCTCKTHPSFVCPVTEHQGNFVEAEGRTTDCDDDSFVVNSKKKKGRKSLDLTREDFLKN